ncbi:MAG TPA: ABC transporter ATP-binding protein [Pseudolabrys sp.]|jgi:NitT/TauT family transport system ATP-binding protein|nr:ABC transporter ATP-binding protein [Pseudolabrys sp.]
MPKETDIPRLDALLEVRDVSKSFNIGPLRQLVLDQCSFSIETGRLTVLIGPSGCGKSTLVNILAGYEAVDAGEVSFLGTPVRGPASDRLVVFQESALFPWMTTYQNVVYGPVVMRNRSMTDIEADAKQLLERVGLLEFKDKYPNQLSGGMQRRAELARAMINNPAIMMLDEPFRGLDAMTRDLMQEYFLRLYEDRKQTVLFVTSEIDEAILLADRLLIMSNRPGRIKHTMSIDLQRPRTPDILTSVQYLKYKQEALEVLHSEAVKAFARGSKAAADFLEAYASQNEETVQPGK